MFNEYKNRKNNPLITDYLLNLHKKTRIMEERIIRSVFTICQSEELPEDEQRLIKKAIEATGHSYSKYSHFSVGAAVQLDNGCEIIGCNQENAAFSVTICAERTALFAAGAQYPKSAITKIAIAASNADGLLDDPITPCGSCRQALIETEQRFGKEIRILLYGKKHIFRIDGIKNLMPLSFTEERL